MSRCEENELVMSRKFQHLELPHLPLIGENKESSRSSIISKKLRFFSHAKVGGNFASTAEHEPKYWVSWIKYSCLTGINSVAN